MNSMFSCFDALGAEFFSGKTLALRLPATEKPTEKKTEKHEDGNGKQFVSGGEKKDRKIRSAPEFDGLNCFETIVRY